MKYLGIYDCLSTDLTDQNIDGQTYIKYLLSHAKIMDMPQNSIFVLLNVQRNTEKVRKTKAYISRKEKQKLNLLKVPKTGWDYKAFEPLRKMWLRYMIDYLNLKNEVPHPDDKNWANFHVLLGKADYHGAEMTVIRSKCPNLVGISGTCILDTKNTFKILSEDNKARTVPKRDSIFKLHVKDLEITIFGKYFASRPADRSAKKVKTSMVLDL